MGKTYKDYIEKAPYGKGRTGRPETGPDAVLPVRHGIRSRAA